MGIVAGLTLLLLIPTIFVNFLVSERSERRNSANAEVSRSWGGTQTIVGPILTIPIKISSINAAGDISQTISFAHVLPRNLKIQGTLNPEIRYRGIYKIPLYSGQFVIEGQFESIDLNRLHKNSNEILWNDAFLTVGISDPKGLRDSSTLRWNASTYASEPGILSNDVVSAGITFKPYIGIAQSSYSFSLPISVNGTSEMSFVPVGEVTEVVLDSPWDNPSFVGSFLPYSHDISADGFHAEWRVLDLNRNFPQEWVGNQYNIIASAFGTSLYLAVDDYQKTSRSIKYALLFIALTFVSFFLCEIIVKTAFHPIQYVFIGFSLILFYILLLSLSEHLRFNVAYLIACLSIILLVTLYTFWISKKRQISTVIFFVLVSLYGFLFVTLQLQDYALLLGSIGLFVVLFVIMYLTRDIDWFTVNKP
jgi:inner membrane protein